MAKNEDWNQKQEEKGKKEEKFFLKRKGVWLVEEER